MPMSLASTRFAPRPIALAVLAAVAALLSACGGGGGDEAKTATPTAPTEAAAVSYATYVQSLTADASGAAQPLSASERAELARLSREWAAAQLGAVADDGKNPFVLPPLHFARLQAVGAAAQGSTLSELQPAYPVPASGRIAAALLRDVTRTVDASPQLLVKPAFLDALAARQQPGMLAGIRFEQLSAGAQAAEPDLRLRVSGEQNWSGSWVRATPFNGVFESAPGMRSRMPMIRIEAPLLHENLGDVELDALALPQGRWLLRLTPTQRPVAQWRAADIDASLARAGAAVAARNPQTLAAGVLALPRGMSFAAAGLDDLRGLGEASDKVRADLRGLDGRGGTYAGFGAGKASLTLDETGLALRGGSTTSFIYSPQNVVGNADFGAYFGGMLLNNYDGFLGTDAGCGATDLKPALLAIVDADGRIDMLARIDRRNFADCP